jgi:two-component system response regulator RegA
LCQASLALAYVVHRRGRPGRRDSYWFPDVLVPQFAAFDLGIETCLFGGVGAEGVKQRRAIRTVLVVDDDEALLRSYARTHSRMERQDVILLTAQDDVTARRLAATHHPDLSVVDLKLGNKSGIDLVRELKAADPSRCVVMVTGYGSVEVTVRAMRAGADDVIQKPVTFREILLRVEGGLDEDMLAVPDTVELMTAERARWEHIQRVLADTEGNVSMAARKLGVYRTTLRRWLRGYAPKQ